MEYLIEKDDSFFSFFKKMASKLDYPNSPRIEFLEQNVENELNIASLGFLSGFIGFFGYELHEETLEKPLFLEEKNKISKKTVKNVNLNETDALWFFADKGLIFDHWSKQIYIFSLTSDDIKNPVEIHKDIYLSIPTTVQSIFWLKETRKNIEEWVFRGKFDLFNSCIEKSREICVLKENPMKLVEKLMREKHNDYLEKIVKCKNYIENGESYELCLTTKFFMEQKINDFIHCDRRIPAAYISYVSLRNKNPSPFALYFHAKALDLTVCGSSPEEFMRISADDKNQGYQIMMKPIKGTIARDLNDNEKDEELKKMLYYSVKDRSENLMVYF